MGTARQGRPAGTVSERPGLPPRSFLSWMEGQDYYVKQALLLFGCWAPQAACQGMMFRSGHWVLRKSVNSAYLEEPKVELPAFMARRHFWNANNLCLTYKQGENRRVVRCEHMGNSQKRWRKLCFKTIWIMRKQLANKPGIIRGGKGLSNTEPP